ncbi:MAG TPA: hypothetical protein ENH49_02790 [Candidatus Marinimicrobia bacterium]|nr:hypothetical protein [Candidatus Neomarinimicrobiota bacterium]
MTTWHKSLELRFSTFPVHQQILMICNELNRAANLQDDGEEYKRCMERSLELLDYFITDKNGHLLWESLRIRDIIAEAYISAPKATKTIQSTLLQMNPTAWCMLNENTNR